MLPVLITLTAGHRNEFIDCQKAKVWIAVLPIMDVETHWNLKLELLEQTNRLCEFTREWLKNQQYSDHWPRMTTQDEWTIVKYVLKVLKPFWYSTPWMSKRHPITLHHVSTVYNDMFDHIDCVMWALAKQKTQWKEDIYFAVKFARQKLSTYYVQVTPATGMPLISPHILVPFRKLQSFTKCDKEMEINPEDETLYTTQYRYGFLKYVENECCAKHIRFSVIKLKRILSKTLFPSAYGFWIWSIFFWSIWFIQRWWRIPDA